MKKILFPIIGIAFVLFSCVGGQNLSNAPVNDTLHVEQYFHKFMARYPDGLANDVKKQKMNEQFVTEITDSLSSSNWLLEDYPLRFKGIKEWKPGICCVHFQSWIMPRNLDFKDMNFHELCFDIVGQVPESYAEILKDDEYYYIKGKLKKFISHAEFESYSNKMAYTNTVEISSEIGVKEWVNWHLGEMLFEIDSITPYKK